MESVKKLEAWMASGVPTNEVEKRVLEYLNKCTEEVKSRIQSSEMPEPKTSRKAQLVWYVSELIAMNPNLPLGEMYWPGIEEDIFGRPELENYARCLTKENSVGWIVIK
jgi:hypothetical protein